MTSSQIGKTYYCSSPALDWRLSGINTIDACITPDPLIYFSEAAVEQLYQHVDIEKGLGILPPRPKSIQKQFKSKKSTKMAINAATSFKRDVENDKALAVSERGLSAPPSTPSKKSREGADNPASSSPSKRKRDTDEAASPSTRGRNKQKWADWEDKILREAIVTAGEKAVDWPDIVNLINANRNSEEPRTAKSIRMHFNQTIKGKMMQP
jgi:hypothetical protein